MPIKSLESYLFERGLAFTFPIDILKNSRIGIDLNHYVSRMIGVKREALLGAVGGFPELLRAYFESDLQLFKELNITPVFVLNGNDISAKYALHSSKDQTPIQKIRSAGWNKYQATLAQYPRSVFPLASSESFRDYQSPFTPDTFIPELIDLLIEKDVEFIRAPYLSWIQLSYLYENDVIDAIYGPTETILLPGVDKFILGMEIQGKEFRYIDRVKVLNAFGVNETQLLDISVAVGCDLQPTTLPLFQGYPTSALFDVGLDIVNSGGSIYHSIISLNNPSITEKFQKGVLALQFMPVIKNNGRVELQHFDEQHASENKQVPPPPSDVHDIIGQRLPHEYYFYESIGLIQPKLLESVSFGTYIEKEPLDGSLTTQYKNTVNKIIDTFKNKEINLLTQNMARFYQVKKIHFVKPFDSTNIELENRMNPPLYFKINSLVIRSELEDFQPLEFLSSLLKKESVGSPIIRVEDDNDPKRLKTNHEIISTSLSRFLYFLGFIDFKDSQIIPNDWTSALLEISKLDSSFTFEQYLSVLIFLKLNPFKLHESLSASLVGGSKTAEESNKNVVQLISRLALFFNFDQKQQSYNGPISRSLLNVRSSIDLLRTNSRELFESILVNSLANNEVSKISKTTKQWRSLVSATPFRKTTPSTALPIVLQSFLDHHFSGNELEVSRSATLDHFNTIPNHPFNNLSESLNHGFEFVRQVFKLVQVLKEHKLIDDASYDVFVKADELSGKVLALGPKK